MIELTKLNGNLITVNENFIIFMEETPDTILTFSDGKKIVVKEKQQLIRKLIIEDKKLSF